MMLAFCCDNLSFVYSGAKLIVTVELVSFSHASDTTFLGDLRVA